MKEQAQARQQLAQLQRQYKSLEGRYRRLRSDFMRVQQQRKTLQGQHARLTAALARVQQALDEERESWVKEVMRDHMAHHRSASQSLETPISSKDRKDLIVLCHPDKWSQGQPATELAHELMVRLTR
jgi:chromosome segregation ATPase